MALCTRCGRQTESAAEFCSGCGTYLGSGGTDRPRTVAARSGGAGYLRPFASGLPSGTALHPGDEHTAWGEPDSGPHQWDADYAGNARFGTHGPQTYDPLTDERPDTASPAGGGFSLLPRGPFEPARHAYPQDDSPAAGFPETGDQGSTSWLPPRFGPDDDPLTARVPPEYPAGSGQYAPGPAIPAQRQADAPYDSPAPDDPLAGYGQPARPQADSGRPDRDAAGLAFPATDSDDWEAEEPQGRALRSGRWITIAATAVVLIICAATAAILLSHGKPPAAAGSTGSHKRPAPSTPPASTIRKPITVLPGAASGPDSPAVVTFLTRYFSAINHHNFAAYRRLFSASLRGGLSRAGFTAGYGSSKDSQITLHAITAPSAGQLTAAVTFTSHQLPAASPNNSACTAWNIALYLRQEGGGLVLVSPPAGYQATFRNC